MVQFNLTEQLDCVGICDLYGCMEKASEDHCLSLINLLYLFIYLQQRDTSTESTNGPQSEITDAISWQNCSTTFFQLPLIEFLLYD